MLVEMIHRVFVSSYEVGLPVCKYKCIFLSCLHVKVKCLLTDNPLNIVCLREFHMHTMELLPPGGHQSRGSNSNVAKLQTSDIYFIALNTQLTALMYVLCILCPNHKQADKI